MTDVEKKDLTYVKNDYAHRIRAVTARVTSLEKRVDWLEKLLWMSAGAAISWLASIALRSL